MEVFFSPNGEAMIEFLNAFADIEILDDRYFS